MATKDFRYGPGPAPCGACGGSGRYPSSVNNGVCLRCNGCGKVARKRVLLFAAGLSDERRAEIRDEESARLATNREKRFAHKQAKLLEQKVANLTEFRDANPDLLEVLDVAAEWSKLDDSAWEARFKVFGTSRPAAIAIDLFNKVERLGNLSDAQVDLLKSVVEDVENKFVAEAERLSLAVPVPTGRFAIEGEVLSVQWRENHYGGSYKMLVAVEDGWKAWGSVPSKLNHIKKGWKIKFTAQFEPSRDDELFGFFKRPTKASRTNGLEEPPVCDQEGCDALTNSPDDTTCEWCLEDLKEANGS